MDNEEPEEIKERAGVLASRFFGCVAGLHQAYVERLEAASGTVPASLWMNLCLEPLYYGLSFFGESARKRYTPSQHELFVAELDKTTRWLFVTILLQALQPPAVGFAPAHPREPYRVVERAPGQVVLEERGLTKQDEEALATFTRFRDIRQRQFQQRVSRRFATFRARSALLLADWLESKSQRPSIDVRLDTGWLLAALKLGLTEDAHRWPEAMLREFAEEVVSDAYKISAQLL